MANSVEYLYRIIDRYSAPMNKIQRATDKMERTVSRAQKSVGNLGYKMKSIGGGMASMQGAIAGAGLGVALTTLVKKSMSVEDAMADVARVTDMSGASLNNMRTDLERLSERIGKPVEGLAAIAYQGAKLGTSQEDLTSFVETVSKMGVAFDMADEEVGQAVGSIRSKLKLNMDDTVKLADTINYLADNTAADGANMINIIGRVSGTMTTLRVPPKAIASMAAWADQLMVSPELAASGLNMMVNRMQRMPGMTKKMLEDPLKAVTDTIKDLSNLPEVKRFDVIQKLFGDEAGRFVKAATGNIELFDKTVGKAFSTGAVGSMDREMANRAKRTSVKFNNMLQVMNNGLARFGDNLKPMLLDIGNALIPLIQKTNNFFENNPKIARATALFLLLATAITILLIPLGMMVMAGGALLGVISAITFPIAAIIAVVAAVAVAFARWYATSHPIVDTFKRIGGQVGSLVSKFLSIFGVVDSGSSTFGVFTWSIDKFGDVLNFILTPLELMMSMLNGIFDVMSNIMSLNFSGAFDSLKSSVGGGFDILGGGVDKFKQMLGFGGDSAMDSQANLQSTKVAAQNVNLGGTIKVQAEKGSKVTKAFPDVNLGTNMEFAF